MARICTAGSETEAGALYDEMVASFDSMGLVALEDVWTANYAAKNAAKHIDDEESSNISGRTRGFDDSFPLARMKRARDRYD